MTSVANAAGRGQPAGADPLLVGAWQQLMGLVLEQRFRWSEVAVELGVTQAGLLALLAIDPNQPQSMRELAKAMNCDPSWTVFGPAGEPGSLKRPTRVSSQPVSRRLIEEAWLGNSPGWSNAP